MSGDGIIHVTARYGYVKRQDVPAALRQLQSAHGEGVSYSSLWCRHLFIATFTSLPTPPLGSACRAITTVLMGANLDV